jgi:hypothetical protein
MDLASLFRTTAMRRPTMSMTLRSDAFADGRATPGVLVRMARISRRP